MTIKQILKYPNKDLTVKCTEVTEEQFETEEFKQFLIDLKETAVQHKAEGLAAPQIGSSLRVFISKVEDEYRVFVNPKLELEGDVVRNHEGCLSFPGVTFLIKRSEECTVTAKDENGNEFTYYTDGIESVAIQHETDHLDGILMVDRLSRLEKRMFLKKLNKYNKQRKRYVEQIMKNNTIR